jgi:hypothetical protein
MADDVLLAVSVSELHIRLAASLVQVSTPVVDVTDDAAVTRYARLPRAIGVLTVVRRTRPGGVLLSFDVAGDIS